MTIYADANATYPVASRHYDAVLAMLRESDGNPSSIHAKGRAAKIALEAARTRVARLLGAKPVEIVFTSGATEANNMALQGLVTRQSAGGAKPHVIISGVEHSSVKEPAVLLAERGLCTLDVAPVGANGAVDVTALLALVRDDTALVCLMHANNETGIIQPLSDAATAVKAKNPRVHVHTDAVQALGKMDLTWYTKAPIDSASLSAHKIGGFKGVGALYLKNGTKLALLIAGGGQERGRRPGTENLPGILSFGLRADDLYGKDQAWTAPMRARRDAWVAELAQIPGAEVHGDVRLALPNTVNFHVDGVAGDDILLNFDLAGVHASSGSACSSGSNRPSPVLKAMGHTDWVALNSVRVSFGDEGSPADAQAMGVILREVVARVRR